MLKTISQTLLSASLFLSLLAPAAAAPLITAGPAVQAPLQHDLVQVRHEKRGFHRHHRDGYYNGHRGYREKRRGYRYHNGFWFPPAAFALGVIIGETHGRADAVRPGYMNPQHVSWCHDKYRSYRQRDNSYQPYHGPRRECRSPYY